jgi:3-deoxy-manno-octulosonate cytidylyltransferase (CMP-KDO synthetase)
MEKITCIIPARLNSSRFPSKPLAKILGREMILRVADIASRCKYIDRIIIATEDLIIKTLCEINGYESQITTKHNTCTHRVAEVSQTVESNYIVNLQGDEPLIDSNVLDNMIEFTLKNNHDFSQAIYPVNEKDILDHDCVKCIVNNQQVTHLTRNPEMRSKNLYGISGLYVYKTKIIQNWEKYDLTLVNEWNGLDTFGFIGAVKITPFMLEYRTLAVDRPEDIIEVEKCLI